MEKPSPTSIAVGLMTTTTSTQATCSNQPFMWSEVHLRILTHALMTRCPLADVELLGLQFS